MSAATQIPTERRTPALGGFNLTFLAIEVRRILRNRRTLVFMVIMPVVLYLAFGRAEGNIQGMSVTVKAYEMVSLALYGAMIACTSGGSMVAVERALGWSRQLRLTPLRPIAYMSIKILTALVLGLIPVLLMFAIGAFSGVKLSAHAWLLSGLAIWFGSLVFAALGLFVGYLLPSENVMQFLGPILGVLSIFGGVFFPVSLMGHTVETIAKFTPVYGVAELARAPLGAGFEWTSVLNIALWLAVFAIGSALVFRRDTQRV
jgi:ABC-2 type transport system permease protein